MLHDCRNTVRQILHGWVQFIGTSQVLEVAPIAFNRVQGGAILGQPKDLDPGLKQAHGGQDRVTGMVSGIVHHQNDFLGRKTLHHQVLQELNKGLAIRPFHLLAEDLLAAPMQGSDQVKGRLEN